MPSDDAEHVRQGPAEAEVRAGCHQHQVVRPRRNGRDKCEAQKGGQDSETHGSCSLYCLGATIAGRGRNMSSNILLSCLYAQRLSLHGCYRPENIARAAA